MHVSNVMIWIFYILNEKQKKIQMDYDDDDDEIS